MSALAALGLEPATDDPPEGTSEATPPAPEVTEPVVDVPEVEEPVVVPPGAENPDAVKAAIQAERKKAREANAAARDLERQLAERDAAAQPLEDRLTAAEQRAQDADLRAIRLEVALDKGLKTRHASRLVGSTKAELEADADALLADLGVTPTPGLDGGYKKDPPKAQDPAQAHNEFIVSLARGARQQ